MKLNSLIPRIARQSKRDVLQFLPIISKLPPMFEHGFLPLIIIYAPPLPVCRANSFKRSISHVEFNKSHVVLRNDVQFSKSTSHLLKTTGTF